MESKTYTKGNVIVEYIQIGDIHYEYELGVGLKCEVISKPVKDQKGNWVWQSKTESGSVVDYLVNPNYPSNYAVNLYDFPAYEPIKDES